MADSPTPPDRRRARQLAFGGLLAGSLGFLVAVVTALSSGGGGPHLLVRHATTSQVAHTTTAASASAREPGSAGSPRPLPILQYHVVADPPLGAPSPDLYVPLDEFEQQLRALDDAGYTAVTLREAWDAWHDDGPLPAHPLVVSFDDGYRSQYASALPVLRELDWPAVLNLRLSNIRGDWGLTEPQVRALLAAGWELDSQTFDHPDLTAVDALTLEHEVADSRAELKRRFDVPADFFSYPDGRYDDATIAAVQRAGYLAATTEDPGLARPDEADRFTLARVRVDAGLTGDALVAQLADLVASD